MQYLFEKASLPKLESDSAAYAYLQVQSYTAPSCNRRAFQGCSPVGWQINGAPAPGATFRWEDGRQELEVCEADPELILPKPLFWSLAVCLPCCFGAAWLSPSRRLLLDLRLIASRPLVGGGGIGENLRRVLPVRVEM